LVVKTAQCNSQLMQTLPLDQHLQGDNYAHT